MYFVIKHTHTHIATNSLTLIERHAPRLPLILGGFLTHLKSIKCGRMMQELCCYVKEGNIVPDLFAGTLAYGALSCHYKKSEYLMATMHGKKARAHGGTMSKCH